jgi:3-methyladenine DNA glycosylase AlkD
MADRILLDVRQTLNANSDEKVKKSALRFFKEQVKFYGVKMPAVRKIAQSFFRRIKDLTKNEIFAMSEELLKSGYSEEAFVAFEWAYRLRASYTTADFEIFAHWLRKFVSNWAECDTLCNHCIGTMIEKYPHLVRVLKKWAGSSNRWVKRGAAVTLILTARRGLFLKDALDIAKILLMDSDDLVQKGYGWMLKEASRKHPKEVLGFILKYKTKMPRTALRYAIEKMPAAYKRQAMM